MSISCTQPNSNSLLAASFTANRRAPATSFSNAVNANSLHSSAETLPSSIADKMKVPFSLHDSEELIALAQEAGLRNTEVKSLSLTLILEGGIDQATRLLEATPLAPQIAELPMEEQMELAASLRSQLNQFVSGTECHSTAVSNIMISQI